MTALAASPRQTAGPPPWDAATKCQLPDGWRWVKLGDVCEEKTGVRDPRREPDKSFRYVDITSVDNKAKRIGEAKTLFGKDAPSRARQVIRSGDVIVSTTRPNLNTIALIPPELNDQICSTGFCVLRATPDLDSDYLFALVQTTDFVESLSELVKGALYPAVTDKQVRDQFVPLAPLAEQKRIAGILKEQMAAVERARCSAEAQLQSAEALPAAHLRAVFNSPEAQAWPRKRFGDTCELLPAKSISTAGDAEVCAITTSCLSESGFRPSGVKTARMWAGDAEQCVVSAGEVLIARSNTPELVGRAAMFAGEPKGAVASDLTIRLKARDGLLPVFLTAHLAFLYLNGYWKERAGGASGSMKKITRTQIQSELIPIPSDTDQRRIAAQLSSQMASAERLRQTLAEQLDGINKLPAALLREAFSGRI
ncbi:MAG: restriction endonuclease subunit S [Verrucomicrobia bacterium]|nr:restriction endonuclease subunit S [Verrucomicrobiota bacterium]